MTAIKNTFIKDRHGKNVLVDKIYNMIDYQLEDDGSYYEYPLTEVFGYRIYEGDHKLAEHRDGNLFLGGYEVLDYKDVVKKLSNLNGVTPTLFVLRDEDRSFMCGMDLIEGDKVWVGVENGLIFDSIEDVIKAVNKSYEDYPYERKVGGIYLEESFKIY